MRGRPIALSPNFRTAFTHYGDPRHARALVDMGPAPTTF